MNKILTLLIAGMLFFSSHLTAQGVTVTIGNKTAEVGSQVCVPVSVKGMVDIVGVSFAMLYDPAKLEFDEIKNINFPKPDLLAFGLPGDGNVPAGKISVVWADFFSTESIDVADNTVIFEVCFTVLNTNSTTTNITFAASNPKPEFINESQQLLAFTGQQGTVTITGGGGGTGLSVTVGNASGAVGAQVCLPVSVTGFSEIGGMQFSLQYNTSILQFVEIKNVNFPMEELLTFGLPGTGNVPAGNITAVWADIFGAQTISIPNNTVIFDVCFNILSTNATSTQVTFNGPTSPLFFDGDENPYTATLNPGTVTISSGGGGGGGDLKISITDKSVQSGQQVCVDVTVDNFTNVIGFGFGIQYDPTKLTFVSAGNFGITGFGASNMGTPNNAMEPTAPGMITATWFDPTLNGVTRPNGTVLFQLCFTATGAAGTTDLVFVNPGATSPIEFNGKDVEVLPYSTDKGVVTITGGGGGGGGNQDDIIPDDGTPRIWITNKTVQSGQQVCVDVRVNRFTDIAGMQFAITYDPAKLQFVSVGNFGLPGFGTSNVGTPNNATEPTQPGFISVTWFDLTLNGVTKENNSTLMQLCFIALGANGTTASLTFAPLSPIAPIEFSNKNEQVVAFTPRSGTITIGLTTLSLPSPTITNVNCFGQATGAIDLQVQGGSGNFSYKWSNNATTQDISGLAAGAYTVTVTDMNSSQTVMGTFNVTQPAAALAVQSQVQNTNCAGPASGAIQLTVSGGTAPYTYDWSGSLTDNVTMQSNLAAGQYSVTITDAKACTLNSGAITVGQNSTIQVTSIIPVNIDNGNDGAVNLTATGGTGNFTYKWTGPNNFTSTQQNLSGLATTGEYCVTITDATGCTATSCVTVRQKLKISQELIARACAGTANGGITLTVTGGQPNYTFLWNNSATTQNLTNIPAGTYNVTITDNLGSTVTGSYVVSEFAAITLTSNVLPSIGMGSSNGSIQLNISGGNAPYQIMWSNGATTPTISNLAPGEYCVTVTDNNNCPKNACYNVPLQSIPLSFSNVLTTNLTCNGSSNGAVSFQIQGGAPPYNIVFNDNFTISNNMGMVNRGGLVGGSISFIITDNTGTSISGTAEIGQPAPITITDIDVVHDSEESGCTGRIAVTIQGGTSPYTVQWNAPNTGTGTQIINLCEGLFVPTIRDANGCIQTLAGVEVNTFKVNATIDKATCPQESNAAISLNVLGGAMPYQYSWRNANNQEIGTAKDLVNVAPGVYTLRIKEASGNELVRQYVVESESNLDASVDVISDYNGADISCVNAKDGILQAIGLNGEGVYQYNWKKGTASAGTGPVVTGVDAGVYTVEVTDEIGCKVSKQVEVFPPDPIQVLANIRDISCVGNKDGEIIVSATGGATGKPYTFSWSTNVTGPRLSFLAPGTYAVTATDANNCEQTASFMIAEPKPITVKIMTEPATDGCNGTALAVAEGGAAPYTYVWNTFPNNNSPIITNLCPGPYFVVVTDSRGCTSSPNLPPGLVEDDRYPCIDTRVVITPDGDGLNEEFIVNCINEFNSNHLEIYNRWGQLVFEVDNYDNTWRGTDQNGNDLPEGPYYYILEYIDFDNNLIQRKGSITILKEN